MTAGTTLEQFDQLIEWLLDMMEPEDWARQVEHALDLPRPVFMNLYRRACIKSMQATINQTVEGLSNDNGN